MDALRALAAVAIAVLHFRFDAARFTGLPLASEGALEAGVDLFFVISGFVMVLSSNGLFGQGGAPKSFLIRRVTRIVPIYWLTTAMYVGAALVLPSYRDVFNLPLIVASFLFIPWPRPDGILQPVVGQGWTLQLEMFFYVLLAAALLLQRGAAVLVTTVLLIAAVAAGQVWTLPPSIAFFTQQIVFEFALGMLLGLAYANGLRLPRPAAWALMLAGVAWLFLDHMGHAPWSGSRLIRWGLPAFLIVAGAALSELAFGGRVWRALAYLGQGSYALYLLHSLPNRAVIWSGKFLGLDFNSAMPVLLLIALLAAIALAMAVHVFVELPTTRALRRLFKPHQPANAAAPTAS